MNYLFSKKSLQTLQRFLKKKPLLAFDYDGTLSPLGPDPKKTKMSSENKKLFQKVCFQYPCVVITGRSVDSVKPFLTQARVKFVVGNHGADMASISQRKKFSRWVLQWENQVKKELHFIRGLHIENKTFSLSLHIRKVKQKRKAPHQILASISQLKNCRIVPGKQVFNLIPKGAPNKALVLQKLQKKMNCSKAIFIGDDVTDEEVFGSAPNSRLFSIRVGKNMNSQASYFLKNQKEINHFLQVLLKWKNF